MSNPVRIALLPKEMLGRRFQYAFLSLGIDIIYINYEQGYAEFNSSEDYVFLVEKALEQIRTSLVTQRAPRDCQGPILNGLSCCHLDGGPKLYKHDKDVKTAIMQSTSFKCNYSTSSDNRIAKWTHLAVSYALEVINKDSPLNEPKDLTVPLLARASLFSRLRGVGIKTETKKVRNNIDTLGTVLLGGALSFLGRFNLSRKGQDQAEFYLLPDKPSETYNILREIAALQGLSGNLAAIAIGIIKEIEVSIEAAISLALALLLYRNKERVEAIGAPSLVYDTKLYTVSPGANRPMIRGGIPLSLIFYQTYTEKTLKQLQSLLYLAGSQKLDKQTRRDLQSALSTCIHSLYLQAQNPCHGEFMVDCSRIISSIESNKNTTSIRESLGWFLKHLDYEYAKIVRGCLTH